ncbi:unnamed protein product, partial [Amoebophrya sp. A25]
MDFPDLEQARQAQHQVVTSHASKAEVAVKASSASPETTTTPMASSAGEGKKKKKNKVKSKGGENEKSGVLVVEEQPGLDARADTSHAGKDASPTVEVEESSRALPVENDKADAVEEDPLVDQDLANMTQKSLVLKETQEEDEQQKPPQGKKPDAVPSCSPSTGTTRDEHEDKTESAFEAYVQNSALTPQQVQEIAQVAQSLDAFILHVLDQYFVDEWLSQGRSIFRDPEDTGVAEKLFANRVRLTRLSNYRAAMEDDFQKSFSAEDLHSPFLLLGGDGVAAAGVNG